MIRRSRVILIFTVVFEVPQHPTFIKDNSHSFDPQGRNRIVGYIQVDADDLARPEFAFLSVVPTEEPVFSRISKNQKAFTPDLLVYLEDVVFSRNTEENARALLVRLSGGGGRGEDGWGWLPVADQRVSFVLRENEDHARGRARVSQVRKFVAADVKAKRTGKEVVSEKGKLRFAWPKHGGGCGEGRRGG